MVLADVGLLRVFVSFNVDLAIEDMEYRAILECVLVATRDTEDLEPPRLIVTFPIVVLLQGLLQVLIVGVDYIIVVDPDVGVGVTGQLFNWPARAVWVLAPLG